MLKVGITGGIGAGKSRVAKIIRQRGYPVFDSDTEARRLMNQDPDVKASLIQLFGKNAYRNNALNRPFLAEKIFHHEDLKQKMSEIVHPAVRREFDKRADATNSELIFNEAAILFETGAYRQFHVMVLVTAPQMLRMQRVMNRDNVSEEAVKARMQHQWSDAKKRALADFEIVNDEMSGLSGQVEQMLRQILEQSDALLQKSVR